MQSKTKRNKKLYSCMFAYMLLIGLLFAFSYAYQFYLGMECALCAALFCGIQFRLFAIAGKKEAVQRKKCRSIGFLLLLPTFVVGVIAIRFFYRPHSNLPVYISYCIIGILAMIITGLIGNIAMLRKKTSTAELFLRFADCMALAPPTILLICTIMMFSQTDEVVATLGCLTAGVFGGILFLIACNLILFSLFGYRKTKDTLRIMANLIKMKKLTIIRMSMMKDGFLVVGKLGISIMSMSFFMFANTLYSAGMGQARLTAIKMHMQTKEEQIGSYRRVGIIILFSSVCYVLYSIRLFFGGNTGSYSMNVALVIACYTFVEFGINVREIIRIRRSHALEAKALRMISLSATLLCFVLTQTAIMSFANEGDNHFSNALSGVIFGGMSILVGVHITVQSYVWKKRGFQNELQGNQ